MNSYKILLDMEVHDGYLQFSNILDVLKSFQNFIKRNKSLIVEPEWGKCFYNNFLDMQYTPLIQLEYLYRKLEEFTMSQNSCSFVEAGSDFKHIKSTIVNTRQYHIHRINSEKYGHELYITGPKFLASIVNEGFNYTIKTLLIPVLNTYNLLKISAERGRVEYDDENVELWIDSSLLYNPKFKNIKRTLMPFLKSFTPPIILQSDIDKSLCVKFLGTEFYKITDEYYNKKYKDIDTIISNEIDKSITNILVKYCSVNTICRLDYKETITVENIINPFKDKNQSKLQTKYVIYAGNNRTIQS